MRGIVKLCRQKPPDSVSHVDGLCKQDITISVSARSQCWFVLICVCWWGSGRRRKAIFQGPQRPLKGLTTTLLPSFACCHSQDLMLRNLIGLRLVVSTKTWIPSTYRRVCVFLFFWHHGLKTSLWGPGSSPTVGTELDKECLTVAVQSQSCLTLCDPVNCSTPGFPVLHYLSDLAQIHVHWVGDAIQPPHPLSPPSPPAFSLSQHQGLSQWVGSSHQVARVSIGASASPSALPVNNQGWFPLGLTDLISLLSKGLSRVQHHNSKASVLQHSAFFMVQLSHL